MAADIPDPPPAAASPPPIVEPPICRGDGLEGGQAGSVEERGSRSSDESLPPLPSSSEIPPDPCWMQTPITFSCGVLSLQHLQFELDQSAFRVSITSVNCLYELAKKLLYQSVYWACDVPAFKNLGEHDRRALVRHSWSDLVLIGVAQCSRAFTQSAFLNLVGTHAHKNYLEEGNGDRIFGQSMAIMRFISSFQGLNMDAIEYGFLRAAALFNPGTECLPDVFSVTKIRALIIQEWSLSNFPCSLTRNITSHSMKNLTFHAYSDVKLRCVVMGGSPNAIVPTEAVSMATLWPPNTTAPVTLESKSREARNILTEGDGGGGGGGGAKRPTSLRLIRDDRRVQQSRPSEHMGKEQALRVCGAPHEVDRWPAGLEVITLPKLTFSHIKMIMLPILTTSLANFSLKGWEKVRFENWEWKAYPCKQ